MKILHYNCDLRSVLFILLAIAVCMVQWAGLLRHPALYGASLCLAFFACIINHNHQHHPTFVTRGLNQSFGALITLAIGFPATAIIPMHNLNHHKYNNRNKDFVRASVVQFRWNLMNLLLFPFVTVATFLPAKGREIRRWRDTRPHLYRRLVLERLVLYPILVLLFAFRPLETLVYILMPQFFGQWCILAINHVQHDGCDPHSTYNHSRNFVSPWLNWWVFNNGFHTSHHLQPGLHWSLVPQFHGEISGLIDPELKRRSLLAALLEFYVWPAHKPQPRKALVQ
jgi:fatty acid desaturase